MNALMCKSCLFFDICAVRLECDDYTPAGEDAEEAFFNAYIEERKTEFAVEWQKYLREQQDIHSEVKTYRKATIVPKIHL